MKYLKELRIAEAQVYLAKQKIEAYNTFLSWGATEEMATDWIENQYATPPAGRTKWFERLKKKIEEAQANLLRIENHQFDQTAYSVTWKLWNSSEAKTKTFFAADDNDAQTKARQIVWDDIYPRYVEEARFKVTKA